MKAKLATLLAILGLVGGTGGAFALAGSTSTGNNNGGAACGEYTGAKDPDANGDLHSNCHTGSKGRGAGGEDRTKNPDKLANKSNKHHKHHRRNHRHHH